MIIRYIACVIIALMTIMGCPEAPKEIKSSSTTNKIDVDGSLGGSLRFIDREAGVVCYMKVGYGGISCISIQHTNLKEKQ